MWAYLLHKPWVSEIWRRLRVCCKLGEETRVITVRIPQSLHDALKIEAYEHRTSINKLCISKLLQFIDADHVPSAFEGKNPEGKNGEKKAEAGL